MNNINLNDILRLEDLENVKIKFNLMFGDNWNPIALFKNGEIDEMLDGYYWNYKKKKSYKKRQVTVGFVRTKPNENLWLLFHIGRVNEDLNKFEDVGYEYEALPEFEKYFGRFYN